MITCGIDPNKGEDLSTVASTLDDWLTTNEVANHYGVPVHHVLRMIREGRLKAQKKGWQQLVHVSDLPKSWPPPVR